MEDHVDFSDSFGVWWRRLLFSGAFPFGVVVGPRKSGKSSWFRRQALTDRQIVVWNVTDQARASAAHAVWHALFDLLGVQDPDGEPGDVLDTHLSRVGDVVLVVEDWDVAIDGRGVQVSDACYEVLDRLWSYIKGQEGAAGAKLGLVLVTSLPDASDLEHFSRAVQRPTFRRLSGMVAREMVAHRFPFLTRSDSGRYLVARGLPEDVADRLGMDTGGWLWLLEKTADAYTHHGAEDATRRHVEEIELPRGLAEAVLPSFAARPEIADLGLAPMEALSRALHAHRIPQEFGLPADYDEARRPAPMVRRHLSPVFLAVDTENIRVPFAREAVVDPERYPDGVGALVGPALVEWISALVAEFSVPAANVLICGKNRGHIEHLVGTEFPATLVDLPWELRGKGGADDMLIGLYLLEAALNFPLANIVLVSGDKDVPLLLECKEVDLGRLVVCTPWSAPKAIRERQAGLGGLRENGMRIQAREVPESEYRAALARRRRAVP